MPDRYWVGGSANWDATAGTKWAATSGGPGGETVPTTADDVYFDANSTGTVNVTVSNTGAKSINCTGFTGTFTGTGAMTIAGSVTLAAGMTYTHTGTMTFTGTGTLTTAGKTFSGVTVNGAGITLTLGDALNIGGRIVTVTAGTFTTANFNVTAITLSSSNSNTRTINLGSSTVVLTTVGTALNFTTPTNLTFNAGTSQINLSGNVATFQGGGQTFHNVSFTATTAITASNNVSGANTFNNLTITAPVAGTISCAFSAGQTITGTLTCAGATAIRRLFIASNIIGTARTITAAAVSANDCDFRDITIAGAAAPISPTRAGDCGGNSGITFPAAKTAYRVGTNTTWAGSNSWALTSGGIGSNDNFPLAQDTAVINEDTALTGTLALAIYNIGSLDASTRTTGITLSHTVAVIRHGSYILGSGITVTGTSTQTFSGRGTMDFTSAGKTILFAVIINAPGGTFRLLDATSYSNFSPFGLTQGTLDLNDFTLTASAFSSTNSNTRTLAFGLGNITATGTGTVCDFNTPTNLTVTGTPVVNITNSTATATTVFPGVGISETNSISFNFTAGNYSLTLGAGNVRSLNFTGFGGTLGNAVRTIFGDVVYSTGMTLSAGASTQTFASTSGTPRTITTNGKTLDFPVTFNGAGGTFRLLDALTQGATRLLGHSNGTLDLNGFTLTVGTQYSTGVGTKNLTFNGGTLVCPAASTIAFNNGNPSGFTTTAGTGTGTINMTAATAKTFVGGTSTYNCTLNNGGAGALTISASNTFTTLANSVQPTSFLFTAGTTQTVTNWNISGTPGNLVTIGSPTAASHTLSKASGTVSADYLSISFSTATGGATWYAGANSTDGGNNTGWIFTAPPGPGPAAENTGFFFLLQGGW
jgi:hypothetical protein